MIFFLSIVPAFFCLWILSRGVTDIVGERTSAPLFKLQWKSWNRKFKSFLLIITVFTLGNSSDAFLLLRAKDLGINIVSIPVLWFFFHFSKAIFSIPGGSLSDRIGRRRVMILAWTIYGLVYLGFGFSSFFMVFSSVYPKEWKGLGWQIWWRSRNGEQPSGCTISLLGWLRFQQACSWGLFGKRLAFNGLFLSVQY
jgi:MFS family permease